MNACFLVIREERFDAEAFLKASKFPSNSLVFSSPSLRQPGKMLQVLVIPIRAGSGFRGLVESFVRFCRKHVSDFAALRAHRAKPRRTLVIMLEWQADLCYINPEFSKSAIATLAEIDATIDLHVYSGDAPRPWNVNVPQLFAAGDSKVASRFFGKYDIDVLNSAKRAAGFFHERFVMALGYDKAVLQFMEKHAEDFKTTHLELSAQEVTIQSPEGEFRYPARWSQSGNAVELVIQIGDVEEVFGVRQIEHGSIHLQNEESELSEWIWKRVA